MILFGAMFDWVVIFSVFRWSCSVRCLTGLSFSLDGLRSPGVWSSLKLSPTSSSWPTLQVMIDVSTELKMTSDAWQKCGNIRYATTYIVIWAYQKTESFEYHWLHTLAMFDVTSFPAILSDIRRHFRFFRYVNWRINNLLIRPSEMKFGPTKL